MKTMQPDPIIAEVHAVRDEYAARFDYDVDRMFQDLQARQATSGRNYVCLPARRPLTDFKVPGQRGTGMETEQPPEQDSKKP